MQSSPISLQRFKIHSRMDRLLNTLLKDHNSAQFQGVGSNRPVLLLLYPETCAFHATTEDAPLRGHLGSPFPGGRGWLSQGSSSQSSLSGSVERGTLAQKLGEGFEDPSAATVIEASESYMLSRKLRCVCIAQVAA